MHTFLLAPTGFGVGLSSISLGVVQALLRSGLKVGFFKPIAQPHPDDTGPERSSALMQATHGISQPKALSLAYVERMIGNGQLDELMEEIVSMHQQIQAEYDIIIVEGMTPSRQANYAERINAYLAKTLDAEVILVSAPSSGDLNELSDRIEMQAQLFGGTKDPKVLGVIINKVEDAPLAGFVERLKSHLPALRKGDLHLIGCIAKNDELNNARTSDFAELIKAKVHNAGDITKRRVQKVILCSRTVANIVPLLQPGVLVVCPGDRDDIILATSLAEMNGVLLAGLLLTGDLTPNPVIMDIGERALQGALPVMSVPTGSYDTAYNLTRLYKGIPISDTQRAKAVTDYIAGYLDQDWLAARCETTRELLLSPPAFRHQLVKRAQAANKRIVLPEGNEPRTIQAAAICQKRGIARCVLLAKPEEVHAIAKAQGIELPADLEIIDPASIRQRFIAPMVELRKSKGLTPQLAAVQLEDTVVLATMMLAEDEVDGLVSGAVHTTASTIRPALQLLKTAPGYNLVSSVFFMLLPDQVLVYGDCAVNPDPDATQLAEIALQSAESAQAFGIDPRVAMISYSTGDSGTGAEVEKVREATRIAREIKPELAIDGPLQYDAASIESVGRSKAPDSLVAGRATVFIFPDLNTGNTTYKAVQRSANVISVGPMLQGLRKPVNDLSRGALVDDIVFTIALTAIQAANMPK
ncbi:phosphate acetyltransferase [Pseudomonas sp. C27(2019)]|mgnify:CR=1 FL=1|uniref:phosphate acetyltransferase n=1 Tax=Pseudomonas sp. C27(2019) TaxID=2604941 RepID=UPI001246B974|nr:phosphate acetyltransferase [Pseudomonas sp. C27(2019)]QEY58014.1 phosphate acetyltransferase [Pseudomonas sp. C27(2019)]